MKKLRLLLIAAVAFTLCQVTANHFWHFKGGWNHKGGKTEIADSLKDSTYHHRNHHHTDSIDFDSIYMDSVKIYHHGHHHFKNDTIPYDSLRHDTLATHLHDSIVFHHHFGKNTWDRWEHWFNWFKKRQPTVDTFYVNNVLYIDSITVEPKTPSVTLPIVLDNQDDITALSFRISLPDGITMATDSMGKVDITADSTRLYNDFYVQKIRHDELVFQYSTKRHKTIAGNSGAIAYITLNIADSLTAGDYTLELTGVTLTDKYDKKHRVCTACTALTISANASKIMPFVNPGTVTGIKTTQTTSANKEAYYDMEGHKVTSLKAGSIYIHGGKKVIK